MTARELAHSVIDNLSDEKVNAFLTLFADEDALSAARTEAAAKEKRYGSFSEILAEIEDD